MYRVIRFLTYDAKFRIVLNLLKSPTLPDQIEPSGPGSGIKGIRL